MHTDCCSRRSRGGKTETGRIIVHVILDVSRLLLGVRRPAASGIDRVEMAYARRYLSRRADGCTFVAQNPIDGFVGVPYSAVASFLRAIEGAWEGVPGAQRKAVGAALPILAGSILGASKRALR